MTKRKGESGVEAIIGLLFATLIMFELDPVIAQAFSSSLSANPVFANSPEGALWKTLADIFGLHIDLILMWIAALAGLSR